MRKLIALVVLAACELKPAPKEQPAPPQPVPAEAAKPVRPPPPVVDPGPAGAAGSAAPRVEISPACLQVGAKVAQVFIDSAKDPAQKTVYEQERANMTRKTGEACTTQGWSEAARKCYLATKTPAAIKACERKFTPPPAAKPPAPSAPPAKPAKPGELRAEPGAAR